MQEPVGAGIEVAQHLFGAGAVSGQQSGDPVTVAAGGHVGLDPLLDSGLAVREAGSAANGEFRRRDFPVHAQFLEHVVREVFGQRPECCPFAAHQAEYDGAAAAGVRCLAAGPALDAVVAADEAGLGGVVPGQRADTGESVDNLVPVHCDVREDVADQVEEVVDLVVGAHGILGHVRVHVGGPHEDTVAHRVDEHDPAVRVLEEDLAAVAGFEEAGVVQHDMRALGAAHEHRRGAHGLIGQVHPRPRGVDDDVRREVEDLAGQFIAQLDSAAAGGPG
ncbi:hypothetical protein D9M72_358360 [compost metagenome]